MGKECCESCKYMYARGGNVPWVTRYFCTVDGDDKLLYKFDNYTGQRSNAAHIILGSRCCRYFKGRE